jgi:hypothetical protein
MAKKEERAAFTLGKEWEVKNVRALEFGTFFTLELPGLALYNLRVVPAGKNYDSFIGMPEDLGKDNKYYKRFFLRLSDEDTEAVLDEVARILDAQEKKVARGRK